MSIAGQVLKDPGITKAFRNPCLKSRIRISQSNVNASACESSTARARAHTHTPLIEPSRVGWPSIKPLPLFQSQRFPWASPVQNGLRCVPEHRYILLVVTSKKTYIHWRKAVHLPVAIEIYKVKSLVMNLEGCLWEAASLANRAAELFSQEFVQCNSCSREGLRSVRCRRFCVMTDKRPPRPT